MDAQTLVHASVRVDTAHGWSNLGSCLSQSGYSSWMLKPWFMPQSEWIQLMDAQTLVHASVIATFVELIKDARDL